MGRKSSRILNDKSTVFLLRLEDIIFMSGGFLLFKFIFRTREYDLFAIGILALIGIFLVPIRLTKRDKFIRDYLSYKFLPKVVYVSKNSRVSRKR